MTSIFRVRPCVLLFAVTLSVSLGVVSGAPGGVLESIGASEPVAGEALNNQVVRAGPDAGAEFAGLALLAGLPDTLAPPQDVFPPGLGNGPGGVVPVVPGPGLPQPPFPPPLPGPIALPSPAGAMVFSIGCTILALVGWRRRRL